MTTDQAEVARLRRRAEKAEAAIARVQDEIAAIEQEAEGSRDTALVLARFISSRIRACLRLDPEAACLREGAPGDDDV